MHKVSGSIQGINYPCGVVSQLCYTTSSSSFFPNELKLTSTKKIQKRREQN